MAPVYGDWHECTILEVYSYMATRVVHMASNHPPFDTRIFIKQARSLAAAGYELFIVAPGPQDMVHEAVNIVSVPPATSRRKRMLHTARAVYKQALKLNGDIYHFHDPELIPYAWLLKMRGKKVIYDVHEDRPRQVLSKAWIPLWLRRPVAAITRLLDRITLIVVDHVIVATPAIEDTLRSRKTTLVQNFPLLDELWKGEAPHQKELSPQVAFVGGITRIRGIREMVEAIGQTCTELGVRLVLAGEFSDAQLLEETRNLEGWRCVDYRGWQSREEVSQLLTDSRAGLVLYHPEPNHVSAQPNKLFEYMSTGIPVIASDFPLWRDIIAGANCGLLVNPQDSKAIAGALRWLINNPEEATLMGRRGRAAVERTYNWGTEATSLLSVYSKLTAPSMP